MLDMRAADIAASVRDGEVTAAEVLAAFENRIGEANPLLNAVVGGRYEGLDAEVAAVDARVHDGKHLSLAGVPVIVKDVIWVQGRTVTQGSALFKDFVSRADAVAVQRLRLAGAVVIGMGNTSEFACKGVTTNRVYGPTLHPMDPTLTPGGSSGGCATGVAAHFAPLALGTDGGGSSRRPPAHVGVVGFKPSFGAVPDPTGFRHPFEGLQVIAPIARTVADAALLYRAIAGCRGGDSGSAECPDTVGEPLRIAYSPQLGLDVPVDDDVRVAVDAAVKCVAALGYTVDFADPSWPPGLTESALTPLQHCGLAELFGPYWRRSPDVFDPDIADQIERGLHWSEADVAAAHRASCEVAVALSGLLAQWDVLVCPTTPCVAWPADLLGPATIGGRPVPPRAHAVFTPFVNHAGVCAITIPCGSGRDGLPVGIQLIAARGRDRFLLHVAAAVEQAVWPLLPENGFACVC